MNRTIITKRGLHDPGDEGLIPLDPAAGLAAVWPMTCDAWAFMGGFDAEQGLQRDIANKRASARPKDLLDVQILEPQARTGTHGDLPPRT
jgi:hypothetical protein